MAAIQQNTNEKSNILESFASLEWLDGIISFVFLLLAKLAEPFLAAGLVMSAIDYMSKGTFLVGTPHEVWIVTQGFALESSGGVVLALSFDARSEGDTAKMWAQRILALALLTVGGILFFVEMAASVKGLGESMMPDWYIYGVAALRSVVSLGYIAMMRTKHHRFSDEESAAPAAQPGVQVLRSEIEQIIEAKLGDVRSLIEQAAQSSSQALLAQISAQSVRTTTVTQISEESQVRNTDLELCAVEVGHDHIHRFILEIQQAQGRTPTLKEIMDNCGCAKNTAVQRRRDVLAQPAQEGENQWK